MVVYGGYSSARDCFLALVVFPLMQVAPIVRSHRVILIPRFISSWVLLFSRSQLKSDLASSNCALGTVATGTDARQLILGFMVAGAVLSMWMTNTSTTMMLLPIAVSVSALVIEKADGVDDRVKRRFQVALLLALAYATTIGGMATLIGTPPNAFLAGFMEETYGIQIAFLDWFLIGLPPPLYCYPLAGCC